MVKIFTQNEKLYMVKAGKEIELSSVTIHHYQNKEIYEISAFTAFKDGKKQIKFKQKTYPLIDIKLEDTRREDINKEYKSYYYTKGKYYYINYYVMK